jgi:chloramphenicol-sensitive protein RarD
MGEGRKGVLAIVGAATIWGLSTIFYRALSGVPPLEVLSQRTLWSAAFLGGVLLVQGRSGEMRALLARPRCLELLVASAIMVSTNWLCFIWAMQNGRALDSSLGYYIFPLFAVALGYLLLGERFTRLQALAIGLGALAVTILTWGFGVAPWLALLIAASFALYGYIKGQVPFGSALTVFVETLLIAPIAIVWLWGIASLGWTDADGRGGSHFGQDGLTTALLVLSGPMTGVPLMLFSYAARRIPYATLGLIQYLNPTLQFVVAVALFGEPFTPWHGIAFPLIWAGLALYSWGAWRQERDARSRAITAGTVS